MLSVFSATGDGFLPCPKESSPPITNDCYLISLKKIVKGEVNYGRTQYDFTNGALIFIAPRQVLQWDSSLSIHPIFRAYLKRKKASAQRNSEKNIK